MKQTLGKKERLHHTKQISILFTEGDSFFQYPFKVIFMKSPQEDDAPVKLLVSVSKRNFKNAVDRNRIKRIIREAYRKNKHILYNTQNREAKTLLLGLIYTPKSIPDYKELERKIILILQRLNKEDAETTG